MDQDSYLKEILANGIEQPSSNFTGKVLSRLAKQRMYYKQKVEIPSAIIWLSVLMPILSIAISLEPVYAQVSTLLKILGLGTILSQKTIMVTSMGILFFSLLDIFLIKRLAKEETKDPLKPLSA